MPESLELFVFRIDDHLYGIPSSQARAVVRDVVLKTLPGAPPIVEGIIVIHDMIVPVLDVRSGFGLQPSELHASEPWIVAWTGTRVVAFRVAQVIGPKHVERERIVKAADTTTEKYRLNGMVWTAEGVILFHDLAGFLSPGEEIELTKAIALATAV